MRIRLPSHLSELGKHPALSLVFGAISLLIFSTGLPQATEIEITHTDAKLYFPDEITFSLEAQAPVPIQRVELEYGLNLEACGTDLSLAIPENYEPNSTVQVSWTWIMRQTGSLPPGAQIWWRWHLVDELGREHRTATQWLTWLDDDHSWQTKYQDQIGLHWYEGSQTFAQTLLDTLIEAYERLSTELGVQLDTPMDFYIYWSTEEMREAVYFEAQWTGALAYSEHQIVIAGINKDNLDWGLPTLAHELGHILIASRVNHCYSDLPTWLNEGLAVYAEGGLDEFQENLLREAIEANTLFSVRALSDGFTEHSERARLSYAQSYDLVRFLVNTYGQAKLLELLDAFQVGFRQETAIQNVYGQDLEEIEAAWRSEIGALPIEQQPRSLSTPTTYPTLIPIAGQHLAQTATPRPPAPLPSEEAPEPISEPSPSSWSNWGLTLLVCFLGGGSLIIIGAIIVRRRKSGPGSPFNG